MASGQQDKRGGIVQGGAAGAGKQVYDTPPDVVELSEKINGAK